MFFSAEDDEQDFISPGGSNLGSLFGMDKASNKGGNESLTYTAPKQPKKKEASPAPSGGSASSVMFATVVHVYKFVENQYASQGKLGAAVLGSPTTKYHILLYITKQKQVSSATIFPAFKLVVQANNYANFYDDARQNWSLMFDTEANAIQFAKQVALAKANSSGQSLDSLISQDLTPGEGGALETGDSVEVRYTGWLLTDNALGQVFDTNTNAEKLFRFRVGKGKVIKGWDSGVIGMKKGGKRLLIVPPSMGYGAQAMGSKIPPNSTLVFEIEVVRVKLSKADSPQVSPAPTPVPNNLPALDSDGGEDITVKERSRSISEQMSHSPKTDKAKLISRMAKMGKPMLPLSGAVAAQTDSDDDSVPASPKPQTATKPVLQPEVYPTTQPVGQPTAQFVGQPIAQPVGQPIGQPVPQVPSYPVEQVFSQPMSQPAFLQNMPGAQQLAVFQPQNFLQQQQQQAAMLQQQLQQSAYQPQTSMGLQQPPAYGTQMPQQAFPGAGNPPADINTPVLLSETRQQNTEVRLSLGKVSDKMDRIMEKIEHLESHNMNQLALQPSAPTMETSVLLFNIQRLVQENERLKKDVFDKGSKIESQNEKISELLQKNQVYVEKSQTLLEERNEGFKNTANQSQAKVLSLEQEKVQLATDLSKATSELTSLQMEITSLKKNEADLRQRLDSSTATSRRDLDELDRLRQQKTEDEGRLEEMIASVREMKQLKKSTEHKMSQVQEEYQELRATNESLSKNLNDRKRKAAEERRKLEEEMEDLKINYEQETTSLREKLRRQKTSKDSASAEQVAQLEQELAQEWKQKSDKLLATAHEKHSRALQEMQDEKTDLLRKNQELEKKVQSLRSSTGSSEVQISALQDQLDDMSMWKDKYENLRNQATSMKERYEDRLKQMAEAQEQAETDRDEMAFEKDRFVERVKQLQQQLQQQETQVESLQAAQQTPAKPTVVPSVVDEVKKIMNTVYRQIRGEFETDESYTGSEILTVILNTIKTTTLSLVKRQTSEVSTIEESEEDSDEEEEENQTQDEPAKETNNLDNSPGQQSSVVETDRTQSLSSSNPQDDRTDLHSDESENNTTEASFPMDMSENKSSETFIKIDVPSTETFTPLDIPSSEPSETFPPVDTLSLEQATEPMKSNDASIIGEIEGPMKSVDIQSTEQNTEPMKSVEIQNTEHKTEPIKSIDSVTEQIEQPIKSVDIHNTEETEPIESVEESPEPSTESFTPVDINSSEQLERQLTTTVAGPVQSLDGEKVKRVEDEEDMFSAVEDNDIQSDPEMKPDSVTEPTTAQLIEQVNENTNSNSLDNNDQPDDRLVNESLNNQSNGRIDNNIENKQSSDELVPEIKDDQSRSRSSTQDVESISDPLLIEPPEIKEEQSRSRSSTQDVESISDPLLMEPPPLEEKSDDSPLFGDDDMVEDMFGTDFKQKEVEVEEEEEEKPAKTSSKQMSKPELSEDEMKPKPPPPLFSDDDDDDDLDWLNS